MYWKSKMATAMSSSLWSYKKSIPRFCQIQGKAFPVPPKLKWHYQRHKTGLSTISKFERTVVKPFFRRNMAAPSSDQGSADLRRARAERSLISIPSNKLWHKLLKLMKNKTSFMIRRLPKGHWPHLETLCKTSHFNRTCFLTMVMICNLQPTNRRKHLKINNHFQFVYSDTTTNSSHHRIHPKSQLKFLTTDFQE